MNQEILIDVKDSFVICSVCRESSPQQPTCQNCGARFTEHICISCGIVWYCPNLRYVPHTIWKHTKCVNCARKNQYADQRIETTIQGERLP